VKEKVAKVKTDMLLIPDFGQQIQIIRCEQKTIGYSYTSAAWHAEF
jgi:hypothetical protein